MKENFVKIQKKSENIIKVVMKIFFFFMCLCYKLQLIKTIIFTLKFTIKFPQNLVKQTQKFFNRKFAAQRKDRNIS